jgi:hypothetical protein
MRTDSFSGRLRKSVTTTGREANTARRASKMASSRTSSGSSLLGVFFRNQP